MSRFTLGQRWSDERPDTQDADVALKALQMVSKGKKGT